MWLRWMVGVQSLGFLNSCVCGCFKATKACWLRFEEDCGFGWVLMILCVSSSYLLQTFSA